MTSSATSGVPMLRGEVSDALYDGRNERRRTTLAIRAEEARLERDTRACPLVSSGSRWRPVRATLLQKSMKGARKARVGKTEHVRAYAFDPSSPCSSPANATSSTLVWNLRPSSLIRWAIASNEMVPEPSSFPPGAYNMVVSARRAQSPKWSAYTHARRAKRPT